MLKLISLASSSKGNMHLLSQDNGKTYIALDCGIDKKHLMAKLFKLNISLDQIKGVVVTHFHGDHIKGIKALLPYMKAYSSKGTFDQLGYDDINLIQVPVGKAFNAGAGFTIIAFDALHDDIQPINFIFKNSIGEFGIYITDNSQVKLNLPNIRFSLILIEANFDEDVMRFQLKESEKVVKRNRGYETVMKKRQLGTEGGHLSFQKTIKILKTFKLGLCEHIVLIHVSPTNGYDYFAERVSAAFEDKYQVKQLKASEVEITVIGDKDQVEKNRGF